MAKPNYQFEKRQRDLAKKRKQDEKRQQKLAAKAAADGASQSADDLSNDEGSGGEDRPQEGGSSQA